jgi:hypothetical protein
MVRLLVILLSMATLITAFQNCGSGGTLTLERSSNSLTSTGFSKLLGACNAYAGSKMCDERWSGNAAESAALQAGCAGGYQVTECPSSADKIGVCELMANNQLRRIYYYQGFTQGLPLADELAQAQAACLGTWQ